MIGKCVERTTQTKEYIICEKSNEEDILSILRRIKLIEEVTTNGFNANAFSVKWDDESNCLKIFLGHKKVDEINYGDYLIYNFPENKLLIYTPDKFHQSFIIINEGDKKYV